MGKKIIFTFWLFIGIIVLFSYSKISNYNVLPRTIIQFFPQGWGFFTKSPLDEEFILYKKNQKGVYERDSYTQSHISCFLGLSKNKRFKDMEITKMSQFVTNSSWKRIKLKEIISSKYNTSFTLQVPLELNVLKNNYKTITKGEYLIMKQGVVPFEWSNSKQYLNQTVSVTKIKIND